MWLRYLPSTLVHFPCSQETLRQFSQHFRLACRLCVKLSILRTAGRYSISFCQLFVRPGDFPSTSVNILCGRETFRQLSSTFFQHYALPSNFRANGRTFINFRQHSMQLAEYVYFHQLSVSPVDLLSTSVKFMRRRGTFCQLPSTFRAASKPSIYFRRHLCIHWHYPQLFGHTRELLSTSINFCASIGTTIKFTVIRADFLQLRSTFCACVGPSVNFSQHSVCPLKLSSTFSASAGVSVNFCEHSVCLQKLTKIPADDWKVDLDERSSWHAESWRKLTKGPADARKVDGSSCGHA